MADFSSYFQALENSLGHVAKNAMAKLDHMTFMMAINGLKGTDYESVSIIIDQLVKEHRSVSIPPLYVVAKAHPNMQLRARAQAALKMFDAEARVEELTAGKTMPEGVAALVEHFGNYKKSP